MKKRRQLTATQKNINKINANLQAIAKTFGVNSKAFEVASQQIHGYDFELYDKNGVVQIKNTAENRKQHQTIRAIANKRKSVSILKRKYAPKNKQILGADGVGNSEKGQDFWKWYGELSAEFENLYDEIYNYLEPACEICEIALAPGQAYQSDDYRVGKWEEVFNTIMTDTKKAKEFYDTFGYGIDPTTGENMTFTNEDYEVVPGHEGLFDMDWFKD